MNTKRYNTVDHLNSFIIDTDDIIQCSCTKSDPLEHSLCAESYLMLLISLAKLEKKLSSEQWNINQ
jgi:hypothetical protein